jgi:hypothetical protein
MPPRASKKKVEVEAPTAIVETPQEPKKKGKKPVKVVAVVTAEGIDGSFSQEPRRPLIAHLNIRTNEVLFHDQVLRYDPNPPADVDPTPYDAADGNLFAVTQEALEVKAAPAAVAAAAPVVVAETTKSMPCFTKANLMVQYKDWSDKRLLPDSTEIACFWCAHQFEGRPCVIPEREVNMVYNVYGNFCSPGCGISYLLTENLDPHVRWERMALLHRIYDSNGTGRIFPAPARESLKLFGGPMSIETFRAIMAEKKVRVDLHMPPMVSILGSIDTKPIDFFDTNMKQGAVAAALPQRSVEEGLRLKRNKPLKERESTLDTVMNIKVGGKR